jgi:hypothetical protein
MYLPNVETAVIDLTKLRDYCLNPLHPEGRHKAKVFAAALGIGRNDAEWLRAEILKAVQNSPIVRSESMPFGNRYTVDVILQRNEAQANVRTGWIIRAREDFARLTTCFVI